MHATAVLSCMPFYVKVQLVCFAASGDGGGDFAWTCIDDAGVLHEQAMVMLDYVNSWPPSSSSAS